jgi:PleD family two-component response regulator
LLRYGREEFVVILPNTNVTGAMAIAQWVHGAIKELALVSLAKYLLPNYQQLP